MVNGADTARHEGATRSKSHDKHVIHSKNLMAETCTYQINDAQEHEEMCKQVFGKNSRKVLIS